MKTTFNSLDIACITFELQSLIGMRVNQIYDVDHKTYIFKLARKEEKSVLLIESGIRIHTTTFEWPKCVPPSGFTMKLRKHLKNKRIECIKQIKADRIIDIQFGSGEASYHVILELFNKGNIVLTDYMLITLNVLRPHTEADKFKFTVREKYPIERARNIEGLPDKEKLNSIFEKAKPGEKISKILLPHLDYGTGLIDHIIISSGIVKNFKYNGKLDPDIIEVLEKNIALAEEILKQIKTQPSKGYISIKEEPRADQEDFIAYLEFNPYLFIQNATEKYNEFKDFNSAIDEYFSKTEGQKIELKSIQLEKEALQKVEKIVELQRQRVENLITSQEDNRKKAELIIANSKLIDETIMALRTLISKQISWPDIAAYFKDLARQDHPLGLVINKLKLETNHVSLSLSDPYCENSSEKAQVDIDLALSAFANASRYYDNKKTAASKQVRTMESQDKAVKSATKKAKETLKFVQTSSTITKVRKVLWFEKFYWFVSSDNYLVIGGRDQQQNELVVKKYMKKEDLYVHADIHGSSSIIIKNPSGEEVPPRTLSEAGNMAVCYSVGWDVKVMCSAWWVHAEQVTKTAPSGEYLTTGSFVIRGQKNYLLPAQLALGFGFMFRLEEGSAFRHKDERKPRSPEEVMEDKQVEQVVRGFLEMSFTDSETSQITNESMEESVEPTQNPTNLTELSTSEMTESTANDASSSDESDSLEILYIPGDERATVLSCNDEEIYEENMEKETFHHEDVQSGDQFLYEQENIDLEEEIQKEKQQTIKRGQKSKLKKIKGKYRHQDEEEKQLRMSILQSAGTKRENKRSKKHAKSSNLPPAKKNIQESIENKDKPVAMPIAVIDSASSEYDEETEDMPASDIDIINLLTGQPVSEDELLFAIPVVAPYSTLLNYKFKVKMIPGSGKRSKTAKTALEHFLRQKDCTLQEKTLIRNVNEQTLYRNFPGKVKIALAPQKKPKKINKKT